MLSWNKRVNMHTIVVKKEGKFYICKGIPSASAFTGINKDTLIYNLVRKGKPYNKKGYYVDRAEVV